MIGDREERKIMRKKKIVTVLLTFVMSISVLVGCGAEEKKEEDKSSSWGR